MELGNNSTEIFDTYKKYIECSTENTVIFNFSEIIRSIQPDAFVKLGTEYFPVSIIVLKVWMSMCAEILDMVLLGKTTVNEYRNNLPVLDFGIVDSNEISGFKLFYHQLMHGWKWKHMIPETETDIFCGYFIIISRFCSVQTSQTLLESISFDVTKKILINLLEKVDVCWLKDFRYKLNILPEVLADVVKENSQALKLLHLKDIDANFLEMNKDNLPNILNQTDIIWMDNVRINGFIDRPVISYCYIKHIFLGSIIVSNITFFDDTIRPSWALDSLKEYLESHDIADGHMMGGAILRVFYATLRGQAIKMVTWRPEM